MNLQSLIYLHELRKNLKLDPKSLQKKQDQQLRQMFRFAYDNVRFYNKKFKNANLKPDDIRTINDIKRIPFTTKAELQSIPVSDLVSKHVSLNECVKNITSGSTGTPITTFVGKKTMAYEGAVWLRAYFNNGLRISDKMTIISDPRSFPKRNWLNKLGLMRKNYISIYDDGSKKFEIIKKEKPNIIEGYPSSLAILANFSRKQKESIKARMVFTLAELLNLADRKLISSSFNAEVFDYYGSSELSLMGWECREHTGYHLNSDSVLTEFVSGNEHVSSGERGEIIGTSLINFEMPLIRYKVGDVGVPINDQCNCGVNLPMMKLIEGRNDDLLRTIDGRIISPTVFFPYPFDNLEGIRQFRIIQEKANKITIQLATDEDFKNEPMFFNSAQKNVKKLFGEEMFIDFQILDNIPPDPNGKLRKVISRISSNK